MTAFDAVDRYICEHGQEPDGPDEYPYGSLIKCPIADKCSGPCVGHCPTCDAGPELIHTGCWECRKCIEDEQVRR